MPLTLRIISPQKDLLGSDSTKVFSVHGGTIGRAPDNDWVLPDPGRYVSAHHAIIDYQNGAYYLTDSSSNGVYVNDSDQSVGSGAPIRLHNGDRLRMGQYRFAVSIVNVGRDRTSDTGVFIADDDEEDKEFTDTTTQPAMTADRLGLNLELVEEASTPRAKPPPTDTRQLTIVEAVRDTVAIPSLPPEAPPPSPETAAETQPVETLGNASYQQSLGILLEAAGADAAKITDGEEEKLLSRLGHLIRSTVGGLTNVFSKKDRPAVTAADEALQRNPLSAGDDDLDDTVHSLLFYDGLDYAAPAEAIDEAFADVHAHQVALARAGRAAWLDLLDRMAPATLEASFNKGLTRGSLLGISNKAKYWDLYREFYENLARRADERFGEVFEQTYQRIYQAERDRQAFREERSSPPPVDIPD